MAPYGWANRRLSVSWGFPWDSPFQGSEPPKSNQLDEIEYKWHRPRWWQSIRKIHRDTLRTLLNIAKLLTLLPQLPKKGKHEHPMACTVYSWWHCMIALTTFVVFHSSSSAREHLQIRPRFTKFRLIIGGGWGSPSLVFFEGRLMSFERQGST